MTIPTPPRDVLVQIVAEMRDYERDYVIPPPLENWADRIERALARQGEVERSMKLLGYANPSRIRMTCASKPGGAHLGQVAIYAGESVDPMEIQERDNPTIMGEPDARPGCYSCGCRSDRPRNWMGRSICSKCQPAAARTQEKSK